MIESVDGDGKKQNKAGDSSTPVLDNFSIEDYETTCMATTALLLLDNAILQTKNVGVFYNASIA